MDNLPWALRGNFGEYKANVKSQRNSSSKVFLQQKLNLSTVSTVTVNAGPFLLAIIFKLSVV